MTEDKKIISVEYYDNDDKKIKGMVDLHKIGRVVFSIPLNDAAEDNMGTCLLRGFMDERKAEIVNIIHAKRRNMAGSENKVLIPGAGKLPPNIKVH